MNDNLTLQDDLDLSRWKHSLPEILHTNLHCPLAYCITVIFPSWGNASTVKRLIIQYWIFLYQGLINIGAAPNWLVYSVYWDGHYNFHSWQYICWYVSILLSMKLLMWWHPEELNNTSKDEKINFGYLFNVVLSFPFLKAKT